MFDVACRFNSYINDADVDGLTSMMTDDHRFTDSAGSVVSGKAAVTAAWNSFFKPFGLSQCLCSAHGGRRSRRNRRA